MINARHGLGPEDRAKDEPQLLPPPWVGGSSAACRPWCVHLRLQAEDDRDEEAVPCAPRVQRPAVNLEPVRHLPDGKATKADDPPLFVRVGEALEIWVPKQFIDRVRRSLQGFRER